ncbi:MAG: glycosyltransferase [Flavobacteriales bacterium]|nr:glycosyltransferase [Flavobacteriales bacterium]
MNELKNIVRKVLAVVLYHGYYRWFRKWDCGWNGEPLKDGITAVVSARNEEYILPFCLKSLVGVVDQVVLIDNGSDDRTLQIMKQFKLDNQEEITVDVLEMPGALLGDCRNAGLQHTRHKWHLRWDADMVCRTSGANSMVQIRELVKNDRPRTIQLPRTNLRGDFHHTRHALAMDPGEPILLRFGKDIKYVEYGKFDVIRVPFYYSIVKDSKHYYFHCEGLKSDGNMIYRRQYFEWRELYNSFTTENRPENVSDFSKYQLDWCLREFGTTDNIALKWRFTRMDCHKLRPVDKDLFGAYPDVLLEEMNSKEQHYRIIEKDGRPYIRLDKTDSEMLNYQPTPEDLKWEMENLS